jgi:GNAT superfamily N-acetyltransferase
MTDDEIIARADANYFESWRAIVTAVDGGEARQTGGVLVTNSGMPLPWFNIGFITRPLADPARAVDQIAHYFDGLRLPFIIRVREGVDPAAERACEAAGMPYSDTVPGMVLSELPAAVTMPDGLEVRAAADAQTLQHHVDVIAAAFGMPLAFAQQLLSPRLLGVPDLALYVGYVDGEAVATAALVASHRVAGVYNVACLPSHRKRGYGEAMTWHAVHAGAAIGCTMASLQASEMGRPVYERMGFRLVAPYRTFVRPEHRG